MKLAALLFLWCLTCHAADQASWYGEKHRGLPMANGKRFNPNKLTAASWFYDLGTRVVVTHANRSVVVKSPIAAQPNIWSTKGEQST